MSTLKYDLEITTKIEGYNASELKKKKKMAYEVFLFPFINRILWLCINVKIKRNTYLKPLSYPPLVSFCLVSNSFNWFLHLVFNEI